jgi:MFS superfamily sulfate permease-like transporter
MADLSYPGAPPPGAARGDLLASVVVFLVALPLCLGIAVASGAPPAAGILTGIVGGLVVGVLAGSPLQVSGPAAGLTVLVAGIVQNQGLEVLGVVVLLAGLIELAAGLCRLGQWFRAVSPAVVYGMLAGIGVLIVASQAHVLVDEAPRQNGLANLAALPASVWKALVPRAATSHDEAALLGLLALAVLLLWPRLGPHRLRQLPAPLVALIVATAVAEAFGLPARRVEMPDSLLAAVRWPGAAELARVWEAPVLGAALMVAAIASAETLLCAAAIDQLHQGPRTDFDRELAAQGVGNVCCGLLGALPMTGVIVRSAANVSAGARTRLAAILHGLWLLLLVALVPGLLRLVPTSALAAVLVYTGAKLANPRAVRQLAAYGRGEVLVYAVTAGTIVARDLLTGVLVGLGLAVAKLLWQFTWLRARVRLDRQQGRTVLRLEGAATFLRLPRLAAALDSIPAQAELHADFERLHYIDHACLDLLRNWRLLHQARGAPS